MSLSSNNLLFIFSDSPYNETILSPEITSKRDFNRLPLGKRTKIIKKLDYVMKSLLPSDHPLKKGELDVEWELIKIDPTILLIRNLHTIAQ